MFTAYTPQIQGRVYMLTRFPELNSVTTGKTVCKCQRINIIALNTKASAEHD